MSGKIVVDSAVKPAPMGVWSHGVIVPSGARLLFPGGFTSRDREGNVVAPNDMAGQTRTILENMKAYCAEQGATLDDVVKLTVYVTDLTDWHAHHAVRREYFPVDPPASCLVQVVRLVEPRHVVEIDPVIMLPANAEPGHG